MKKIILATASERKKRLFALLGLDFDITDHQFDEKSISGLGPHEHVIAIAKGKVESIASQYEEGLIIGLDTIVAYKNKILEKPIDSTDAVNMLLYLNGSVHEVVTGLYIYDTLTKKSFASAIVTNIYFKNLTEAELTSYVEKEEDVLDIAGTYDHEKLGTVLLEKIDGDFYNSVGMPLSAMADALKEFDIRVL
ncbi:MAG: Maf family protein [Candidatus Saccharimonadaceae bacterium]